MPPAVDLAVSFYYAPQGETSMNLDLMLLIDKQFLKTPFYGVRQMTWHLQNEGHAVNVKRIRRLMRLMRLMPIYQKPNTRHRQRIWFVPLRPLAGFDLLPGNGLPANHERAQVQLQLAVDAPYGDCGQSPTGQWIDAFVVPWMTLHVAQVQETQAKPQVLRASVSPTRRSAISSFSARSFGPYR